MEKLCINCKHCIVKKHWIADDEYFCDIHNKVEESPVTGKIITIKNLVRCERERDEFMQCGPKGAYWVQK